jgi:hypothetical protein
VTFGLLSSAFYITLICGHRRANSQRAIKSQFMHGTMIGALGLGTLTSLIEAPVPSMAFGMLIAASIAPKPRGLKYIQVETSAAQGLRDCSGELTAKSSDS